MEQADPGDGGMGTTRWRKGSRCDSSACVEVALITDRAAMRDSKQANGPILSFSVREWSSFLAGVRAGDFDPR